MDAMELWDAYDERLDKIPGVTLIRGEPVPAGCFHLACEVIVQHKDGSYLLMQRDPRKTLLGGFWEISASGSALQGEDPYTCALRELKEETGITACSLTELGRILDRERKYICVEYICHTDVEKDSIVLQEGETVAYRWVTADELRKMPKDNLATYRAQCFADEIR